MSKLINNVCLWRKNWISFFFNSLFFGIAVPEHGWPSGFDAVMLPLFLVPLSGNFAHVLQPGDKNLRIQFGKKSALQINRIWIGCLYSDESATKIAAQPTYFHFWFTSLNWVAKKKLSYPAQSWCESSTAPVGCAWEGLERKVTRPEIPRLCTFQPKCPQEVRGKNWFWKLQAWGFWFGALAPKRIVDLCLNAMDEVGLPWPHPEKKGHSNFFPQSVSKTPKLRSCLETRVRVLRAEVLLSGPAAPPVPE